MKTLLMGAGLLMMVGVASCTKDHSCICFDTADQNEITHTFTYSSMSREEARDLCSQSAIELNATDSLNRSYLCTLE